MIMQMITSKTQVTLQGRRQNNNKKHTFNDVDVIVITISSFMIFAFALVTSVLVLGNSYVNKNLEHCWLPELRENVNTQES